MLLTFFTQIRDLKNVLSLIIHNVIVFKSKSVGKISMINC